MALRTYHLDKLSAAESKALLARPRVDFSAILETVRAAHPHAAPRAPALTRPRRQVRPIVEAVRDRGDAAVAEYTSRFDGVALSKHVLNVAVRRALASVRHGHALTRSDACAGAARAGSGAGDQGCV